MTANVPPPADFQLVFAVPGMNCGRCVARIETALRAHPDVRAFQVDLAARRVLVSTLADYDPQALLAALAEAGYPASRLDADAA